MDDAAGRAEATRRGFRITGTLGVLRAAAQQHQLDIAVALDSLSRTNFYLPPRLVAFLLKEAREQQSSLSERDEPKPQVTVEWAVSLSFTRNRYHDQFTG